MFTSTSEPKPKPSRVASVCSLSQSGEEGAKGAVVAAAAATLTTTEAVAMATRNFLKQAKQAVVCRAREKAKEAGKGKTEPLQKLTGNAFAAYTTTCVKPTKNAEDVRTSTNAATAVAEIV